ncbi:MAG TPA: TIGR01777 family oxidoreductase, partial [Bacteroidota bacterium]
MTILLAGGTGFLGRNLARALEAKGHSVMILTRGSGQKQETRRTLVQWDAKNPGDWTASFEKADAVINLAGESIGGGRWTKGRKERILNSRLDATNAIVRAMSMASRKPGILVNASGVDYYGNVREGEVTESSPPGKGFLEETCLLWEQAAWKAEALGVRVVIMRTAFILGRGAEAFRKLQLPFRLFAGGPFGSGDQWFSWIHLHDAVQGYLFALEHPTLSGPVNLSSPNSVHVNTLATELGKVLHRPSFLPAPSFALKMVLGEMSDLLLKGRSVTPHRLKE